MLNNALRYNTKVVLDVHLGRIGAYLFTRTKPRYRIRDLARNAIGHNFRKSLYPSTRLACPKTFQDLHKCNGTITTHKVGSMEWCRSGIMILTLDECDNRHELQRRLSLGAVFNPWYHQPFVRILTIPDKYGTNHGIGTYSQKMTVKLKVNFVNSKCSVCCFNLTS